MFVYMLYCEPNCIYTGVAKVAKTRLLQHLLHTKAAAAYTKSHPPYGLAMLWKVDSKSAALKAEAAIKKLSRKEKDQLISNPQMLCEKFENESLEVVSQTLQRDLWEEISTIANKKLTTSM